MARWRSRCSIGEPVAGCGHSTSPGRAWWCFCPRRTQSFGCCVPSTQQSEPPGTPHRVRDYRQMRTYGSPCSRGYDIDTPHRPQHTPSRAPELLPFTPLPMSQMPDFDRLRLVRRPSARIDRARPAPLDRRARHPRCAGRDRAGGRGRGGYRRGPSRPGSGRGGVRAAVGRGGDPGPGPGSGQHRRRDLHRSGRAAGVAGDLAGDQDRGAEPERPNSHRSHP